MPPPATPPSTNKPSKRAIVAIVLGVIVFGTLAFVAIGVGTVWYQQSELNAAVPADALIGDCYHAANAGPVSCAGPHRFEVFSAVVYRADTAYPDGFLAGGGNEVCDEDFRTYTGSSIWTSRYDYGERFPDEAAWADGERWVLCVIFESELGVTTGSAGSWP